MEKVRKVAKETKNSFHVILKQLKFEESYVSLILGMVVVILVIILAMMFVKGSRTGEVSSIKTEDLPKVLPTNTEEGNIEQQKYTVVSDDTLWSIAEKKYASGYEWEKIAQANKISDPTVLKEGDKIVIPKVTSAPTMPSITPTPSVVVVSPVPQPTDTGKIVQDSYTVVAGDDLWDIAVRAYGDGFRWKEIAAANNLENPDLIFPGNVFKLPR